jgi:hypothetical protein
VVYVKRMCPGGSGGVGVNGGCIGCGVARVFGCDVSRRRECAAGVGVGLVVGASRQQYAYASEMNKDAANPLWCYPTRVGSAQ